MKLSVGLLWRSHGWEQILQQEGISYFISNDVPSADTLPAIIISGKLDNELSRGIQRYLESGGSVLCSAESYKQFSNIPCSENFIRYFLPETNSKFHGIGLMDIFAQCSIPSNANTLFNQEGKPTVYVGKHLNGNVVVLPFDVDELYDDTRTAMLSFYANRKRLPFERVAQVSKNGIRKLVARALELLHHLRGLPYVHTWYYPSDAKSIFSFRIDTDYATKKEIESLYDVIHSHNIPATWFVDVKSQEGIISTFLEMEEQEIGIHCYEHKVFDDYTQNIENIRRALHVFENVGFEPKSFAAPFGTWNNGIAKAIEHCGFEYSSEFAYDYNNLPSFPLLDENEMNVLQLPIHPISIGSLRRQGFSEQEMINYFDNVMQQKLRACEPLFFYHHPKDKHENVLRFMFDVIKKHNIPAMRMIDFAAWWKTRNAIRNTITVNDGTLLVKSNSSLSDISLHITQNDETESWTSIQPAIDLKKIAWQKKSKPGEPPVDLSRIRKFNPWIPLIRFEDFIAKTFSK